MPLVRTARGRDCGRGQGVVRAAIRAAPVKPPVAPPQEQVLDIVESAGSAQAPTMPIVIPGFQEALAQILIVRTDLAQVV